MIVSKTKFADGIIRYISSEVMPHLTAGNSKILLASALNLIKLSPDAIVAVIDKNDLVKLILHEDCNGNVDADCLCNALKDAMNEHGVYTVDLQSGVGKLGTLFLGDMPKLSFGSADIDVLKQYIDGLR